MPTVCISFDRTGNFAGLYSDAALPYIQALGGAEVVRAAAVEPDPAGGWSVTLAPWVPGDGARTWSGFPTHAAAIAFEIDTLNHRPLTPS